RLPLEEEAAAIAAIDARQDLDERRLAGSVLAYERVDFPAPELEAHIVERSGAGERLGQPLDAEQVAILLRHRSTLRLFAALPDGEIALLVPVARHEPAVLAALDVDVLLRHHEDRRDIAAGLLAVERPVHFVNGL